MCVPLQVVTGGRYEVVLFHTSEAQATFSLSVGKFTDIQAGAAPSVTRQLPAAVSDSMNPLLIEAPDSLHNPTYAV